MNKFGRIPAIPLNASEREKAIKGEIMINWEGQYLMGRDPSTGEVVRLGDADSLLGIINYIKDTNFEELSDSFTSDTAELSISKGTGYYSSNELVINCDSLQDKVYVKSVYNIYKERNYTLTFYASSNKNTIMHITFAEGETYDLKISKSPMSKYRLVINTNEFVRNYYNGFTISFEEADIRVSLSQFMFEYGATANPWTDRTEITSVKVGDMNVNGILSIKGVNILDLISGGGVKGISSTSNDIVTDINYLSAKTSDSNFDLIKYTGADGVSESIAYKEYTGLMYGTYSIMLRMKATTTVDRDTLTDPIATINIYEHAGTTRLISQSDIYIDEFESDDFEELGIITKFNGTNSDNEDKSLVIEIVANGNGNTTLQIDFIYLQLAYTSLLPNIVTYE